MRLFIIAWFYRRNCKGNPNCLVAIGEQAWLGEIDENTFHNIDDPNSERRDKVFFLSSRIVWLWCRDGVITKETGIALSCLTLSPFQNTFVGLTNLGATCYVNTFLQVWFHNLELRRSLYQYYNSRAQEHNAESGMTVNIFEDVSWNIWNCWDWVSICVGE